MSLGHPPDPAGRMSVSVWLIWLSLAENPLRLAQPLRLPMLVSRFESTWTQHKDPPCISGRTPVSLFPDKTSWVRSPKGSAGTVPSRALCRRERLFRVERPARQVGMGPWSPELPSIRRISRFLQLHNNCFRVVLIEILVMVSSRRFESCSKGDTYKKKGSQQDKAASCIMEASHRKVLELELCS